MVSKNIPVSETPMSKLSEEKNLQQDISEVDETIDLMTTALDDSDTQSDVSPDLQSPEELNIVEGLDSEFSDDGLKNVDQSKPSLSGSQSINSMQFLDDSSVQDDSSDSVSVRLNQTRQNMGSLLSTESEVSTEDTAGGKPVSAAAVNNKHEAIRALQQSKNEEKLYDDHLVNTHNIAPTSIMDDDVKEIDEVESQEPVDAVEGEDGIAINASNADELPVEEEQSKDDFSEKEQEEQSEGSLADVDPDVGVSLTEDVQNSIVKTARGYALTVNEDSAAVYFSPLDDLPAGYVLSGISGAGTDNVIKILDDNLTLSFRPGSNKNGEEVITYTAINDDGDEIEGEVFYTVNPVNDVVITTVDLLTLDDGSTGFTNLLANDRDIEKDSFSIIDMEAPEKGDLVWDVDGNVSYFAEDGQFGIVSMKYTVQDSQGGISTSSLVVNVPEPGVSNNTFIVHNSDELQAILNNPVSGMTVLLDHSDDSYSGTFRDHGTFDETVTIKSLDADNPAVVSHLTLFEVGNIEISDIQVDEVLMKEDFNGDWRDAQNIYIASSNDITITDSVFSGQFTESVQDVDAANYLKANGGSFVSVSKSTDVTIDQNEFSNGFRGVSYSNSYDVTISNNDFHDMVEDGMRGGGVQGLTISGNSFTDWLGINGDVLHCDFIQIWSVSTAFGNRDILIKDNVMLGQDGLHGKYPVVGQYIFIQNHGLLLGYDPEEYMMKNIQIQNNVMIGNTAWGVKVDGVEGLFIEDNTLLGRGQITVKDVKNDLINSKDVTVTGNIADEIKIAGGNLTIEDNFINSDSVYSEEHYNNLFLNHNLIDPSLGDLYLLPGTALFREDGTVYGSQTLLLPEGAEKLTALANVKEDAADLETFNFSGAYTLNRDGFIDPETTTFAWDFGDGAFGSSMDVSHTYEDAGDYTIKLTVTDMDGEVSVHETNITVRDELVSDLTINADGTITDTAIHDNDPIFNAEQISTDENGITSYRLADGQDGQFVASTNRGVTGLNKMNISFMFSRDMSVAAEKGDILYLMQGIRVHLTADGEIGLVTYDADVKQILNYTGVYITNEEWNHFNVSIDAVADVVSVSMNGAVIETLEFVHDTTALNRSVTFGAPFGLAAEGSIADVKISEEILTQQEIEDLSQEQSNDLLLLAVDDIMDDHDENQNDDESAGALLSGGALVEEGHPYGDDGISFEDIGNVLQGTSGADTFAITDLSENNVIQDFDLADGDVLDISELLQAYDPINDAISDFVQVEYIDDNTTRIMIDMDGGANSFAAAAEVNHNSDMGALQNMVNDGTLIV